MNIFFNKIIGASLAIAMMIGVGVGISANKGVKEVNAVYSGNSPWSYTLQANDISTAAQNSKTLNGVTWSISSTTYKGWDNTKGVQLGSGSNPQTSNWTMTAAISQFGTNVGITGISVGVATASSGGLAWSLTAGGTNGTNSTGSTNSAISSVTTKTATYSTPVTSGNVVISLNSNGKSKAIYIHDISVNFETVSGNIPEVESVSASVKPSTYYVGSTLSASEFDVVVHWTEGKADTNPTSDFTWTVNGTPNGVLKEGNNSIVVTYSSVSSSEFNVVGTSLQATSLSIEETAETIEVVGETVSLTANVLPENTTDTIIWTSSDEDVATVDQNGVVTGVASGTTTITATAGSVSDTCEVTVRNNQKVTIDFTDKDAYSVAKPSSAQSKPVQATVGGYNLNLLNAYNSNGVNAFLMIGTKDLKTNNSLVSNKTAVPGVITKIVFTTTSGASASAIYNATLSNTEILTTVTDNTHTLTGKGSITITADESSNYHFFAISSATSSANGQIKDIVIYYVPSTIKEDINALNTQTSLAYNYHKDDAGNFTYSNIVMRFGGVVSKTDWNELNGIYNITGFGVILMDGDMVKSQKDATDAMTDMVLSTVTESLDEHMAIEYFVPVSNMAVIGQDDDNYYWNLRVSVADTETDKLYSAVAYIKVGDEYVLMNMARTSVVDIALDYLVGGTYNGTTAGESLQGIVDLTAE